MTAEEIRRDAYRFVARAIVNELAATSSEPEVLEEVHRVLDAFQNAASVPPIEDTQKPEGS